MTNKNSNETLEHICPYSLLYNGNLTEIINIMHVKLDNMENGHKEILMELGYEAEMVFLAVYELNVHWDKNETTIAKQHMRKTEHLCRLLRGIFAIIEIDEAKLKQK
jgi:hypothetical protein